MAWPLVEDFFCGFPKFLGDPDLSGSTAKKNIFLVCLLCYTINKSINPNRLTHLDIAGTDKLLGSLYKKLRKTAYIKNCGKVG